MRDEAVIDEILRRIRSLWLRTENATVAGLVHAAVEPAVPCDEIRSMSDVALLRALRAMTFFASNHPGPVGAVTPEHLAALDEARDFDAVSSYNWLRSELQKIRDVIAAGGEVCIEDLTGRVTLASVAEFDAWAVQRYPHA